MSSRAVGESVARGWAHLYTRGLPDEIGERRILELESDMWDQAHDVTANGRADREILGRTLRGIHADVWWRYRTLLEQRGARQRSPLMTTTRDWWYPVTLAIGVITATIGGLGLMVGEAVTGGGGGGVIRTLIPLLGGGLILVGLSVRNRDILLGSRLVFAGALLSVFGDLFLVPLAVVVIFGGFWTGNLGLRSADRPTLEIIQHNMAARWPWWIVASVLLVGVGIGAMAIGDLADTESCTEANPCWEGTAVWATWILSWIAAAITFSIGVVLAAVRYFTRHHTRLA